MECSPCVSSRLRFLAFWSDSHATQMEWRTLPAEHTTEQRQLCRFPLDGKWTKSWDTVCYYNIAAMGFKDKAKSIQGRFADLSRLHHEKFDAVLCNPPYIPDVGGRRKLDVATTAFEPRKALFVNREAPNIHYEHVLMGLISGRLLNPDAILVFEVCKENAGPISQLMTHHGFEHIGIGRDCNKNCIRTVHGYYTGECMY